MSNLELGLTGESKTTTPLGMGVVAKSQLITQDGKRLIFKVKAFDDREKIGEGTHERFIVETDKFINKNNNKLNN